MKMRNKGKVYPSPSSSSTSMSSHTANRDSLSILNLLPAAILALISILSQEDRQVLAYMITRSIKSVNPTSIAEDKKKKSLKKLDAHKPPIFDCECFDCYTRFWLRWDSSPNRELIHQAIEAFEEHLFTEEQTKKNNKGKKKEKMSRRKTEKPADLSEPPEPVREEDFPAAEESLVVILPENNVVLPENEVPSPQKVEVMEVMRDSAASNHKGLARKVLPDVVGLLHSRLWSLWGPNV
ncbi:uncharacterized protein LOC130771289 [Actinidia eriantha]|uniref:uncharacterized protein LOC130771289 n=1 Tax=Actinidia eriantha TaxID=165200 RepID=UPI00258F92B4|nr:uncharacterized protein LOC130771289 [Actinidia eriantha]